MGSGVTGVFPDVGGDRRAQTYLPKKGGKNKTSQAAKGNEKPEILIPSPKVQSCNMSASFHDPCVADRATGIAHGRMGGRSTFRVQHSTARHSMRCPADVTISIVHRRFPHRATTCMREGGRDRGREGRRGGEGRGVREREMERRRCDAVEEWGAHLQRHLTGME